MTTRQFDDIARRQAIRKRSRDPLDSRAAADINMLLEERMELLEMIGNLRATLKREFSTGAD